MSSARQSKKIELPLIEFAENALKIDLFNNDPQFEVPEDIKNSLKNELRPYQNQALYNFDTIQKQKKNLPDRQILFNMATGSGKTNIMAALILYMYKKYNYQNFLFVANTTAVVSKTINNLIDDTSSKYLFNNQINIDEETIILKKVDTFPNVLEKGVIYIKLSTIQTISQELSFPKENAITYDQLKSNKMIILADEAHHFNAKTTSSSTSPNNSWENILDRMRQVNKENIQFEFTATIDLQDKLIYEKYKNKLIYKYNLSQFIEDGYSKKVYRLQTNNKDDNKMLNAVLLSQYRKRIAEKNLIPNFKPIILFKSNRVTSSKNASNKFQEIIQGLNVEKLSQFIKDQKSNTQSESLEMAYDYWLTQNMAEAVVEIKNDFKLLNTLNANDNLKEGILNDNTAILNSLEDPENPFRVIFAVAKLSEGWDVLNLYDIVRIGKQPTTTTQTNSEAQLIGRGARYYPFMYQNKKAFIRRFDQKNKELQLLESLYYHTINDSKYLDNLNKSFDKIDLPVQDDNDFDVYQTTVKKEFLNSKAYKYGNVFVNELEDVPDSSYKSLRDYGIDIDTPSEITLLDSTWESSYDSNIDITTSTRSEYLFALKDVSKLVKKAMSRNDFFRFNSLRKYIPTLTSLNNFITSENWLGNIKLFVRITNTNSELSVEKKLEVIEKYLNFIQKKIRNNYYKKRGTHKFNAVPIKSVVKDYYKKVNRQVNNKNNELQQWIRSYDMKDNHMYVFEDAIVNGLEKSLIDRIKDFSETLNKKYKNVYLIRNDEVNSNIKLHQFDNELTIYSGFMPDFILYLEGESSIYQIYIEPKGDHLKLQDSWKQDLLQSIRPDNISVNEYSDIKIYGVKFYLKNDANDIKSEFSDKGIL